MYSVREFYLNVPVAWEISVNKAWPLAKSVVYPA